MDLSSDAFRPGQDESSPLVSVLPTHLHAALWRADALVDIAAAPVLPSGWPELDRELPGGGWPCRSLVELLGIQPSLLEWRLLGPGLAQVVASTPDIRRRPLILVAPPKPPHPPGLRLCGIDPEGLIRIEAHTPAERLWCAEQLIKADAAAALLVWLPQARPDQLRRLQVSAQAAEGPVFVFRPVQCADDSSPVPLRVQVDLDADWSLRVQILKRRGPQCDAPLILPSVPPGLDQILTPRRRRPAAPQPIVERIDVVGGNVPAMATSRLAATG